MTTYEYECPCSGKRFEIVASMKNCPPEWIWYSPKAKEWRPAKEPEVVRGIHIDGMLLIDHDNEDGGLLVDAFLLHRVYAVSAHQVSVPMPKHVIPADGGLPVSYACARRKGGEIVTRHGKTVREHKDGSYSTLDGKPICDTAENTKKHMDATGSKWDG